MRSFTSALAGAAVAGIVVSGSFAIAAIPDATTKVITVCYSKTSGALRVIDKAVKGTKGVCNLKTESELAFNQQGPQGLPGVSITGPKGDPGGMSCANELVLKQTVPAFTFTPGCEPPPPLPAPSSQLAVGYQHSCALRADTTVKCWGYNASGQLGDGTNTDSNIAVTVAGITGATAITAGFAHSCALLTNRTVKCWGSNGSGQLGDGTNNADSNTPVTVSGITGATAITAGLNDSCALLTDFTVKCWGWNGFGQLGDGTNLESNTPVTVSGITGATAITAGYYHSCALLSDATVKCWGYNVLGQLGDGTTKDSNSPLKVVWRLAGATAIVAGEYHTCGLLSNFTVKCWGYSANGRLGDGTNLDSNTPVTVSGITSVSAISAGAAHSCALLADATINCWGANENGQLGDGTTTDSSTSVAMVEIAGAAAISAGYGHSCALLADATVKCWGYNFSGALGNGTNTNSNTPVSVIGL